MKKDLLPVLRKELENSFGRKILSSRDCLQMVDDIAQKTGFTINANTLRRFFGLVRTNYSPSPSTITILCKYCGFSSIDEIESISSGTDNEESINKEEILHYLVSLFKDLTVNEGHNQVVESLVQQTVIFLERNPTLIDRFQREIAKTRAGQYYYYELSVNMDRLNDYYGDGLRHYLRSNPSDDGAVFVNSLLVFRYWLTDNAPLMEKYMANLSTLHPDSGSPSHILGRYIAARLYHANAMSLPIDKILTDATKFHVAIMANRGNATPSFPHFELAVCEALVLTDQKDEAIEFVRRGKSFLTTGKNHVTHNPFGLWEAIINNKTRRIDLTANPKTNYSYNYHLNKRYNNLLIVLQNARLRTHQLPSQIKETGFTRFNSLYSVWK